MKLFNDLPDLFYLGFYHPQYNYYEDCYKDNEEFDEYSNTILELKNGREYALDFFLKKLKNFLGDEDIAIVTVPSGKSINIHSGIRKLSKRLIDLYPNYTDAIFCLERFKDSTSGDRNIENHLKSVKVVNLSIIKDKKVILIDDILTTGNSIQACKKLLIDAGVKNIKVIVLGKTIRNIADAHDFIEQKETEYLQETINKLDFESSLSKQYYENQKDYLKEETFISHINVDEWADEQYSYCDSDDEYKDIEEESQRQHELINEAYNERLSEISIEEYDKYSSFEYESCVVHQKCRYYMDQAHQVLDGFTCFGVDNPFVYYFKDW